MTTRSAATKIVGSILLITAVVAYWSAPGRAEGPSETDPTDFAIVSIDAPREVNLLRLHGFSGRGVALFRIEGACFSMDVRFVAGDFAGESVRVGRARSIRLRIVDASTARALYEGHDLVSDMVVVGVDPAVQDVDVVVEGLSAETGFVVNAGGGVIADLIGAKVEPISCQTLDEQGAARR